MRYDVVEKSAGKEGHEYPYMVIECAECGTLFQVDSPKCIPYECPVCAAAKEHHVVGLEHRITALESLVRDMYGAWCATVDDCYARNVDGYYERMAELGIEVVDT